MNTELNYICEVYVLLWARHVLCVLVHKDKENYGGENQQRLYSTESELSVMLA